MTGNLIGKDTSIFFIKLGGAGDMEEECINNNNNIYLGFDDQTHASCLDGRWGDVHSHYAQTEPKQGRATAITNLSRIYYEADETVIFITFYGGYLWWCHPKGRPKLRSGGGKVLDTVDGWHNQSLGGHPLLTSTLSGNLTKVQMYRGTLCEVRDRKYLIRRLNDQPIPEVAKAEEAEKELVDAMLAMIKLLDPKDFELLVDLIFSASGWRRQAVTGRTQKTVDLELILPTTGERAFVQVKSTANPREYDVYQKSFNDTDAYDRMFYVWHSGRVGQTSQDNITQWGPDAVARHALNAGLLSWLKDKVS